MRRARGLVAISRRDFCRAAAIGLAVVGCTDGTIGVIHTGPLGGGDDTAPPDGTTPVDGPPPPPPDGPAATCVGGELDVGAPGSFVLDTPVYVSASRLFVVRDSGGLYALTARCTHEGVTCNVSSGRFKCPRHGALFTFDGAIISGPVITPLKHYAMCTLANGNVAVNTAMTVSASTRLNI